VHHPLFARLYIIVAAAAERAGAGAHRDESLAGLAGRVIEVGAGTGLNFGRYPHSVTQVIAIEPEPRLRARASRAARRAPVPVRVIAGLAERLPAATASFDAAVVSLVLCSVADQDRALGELMRVIRPGGELRFYEHVRAREPRLARWQERLDRWLWPRIAGGCHLARESAAAIADAGFEIERCRRFSFRPCPLAALTSPTIVGCARRP